MQAHRWHTGWTDRKSKYLFCKHFHDLSKFFNLNSLLTFEHSNTAISDVFWLNEKSFLWVASERESEWEIYSNCYCNWSCSWGCKSWGCCQSTFVRREQRRARAIRNKSERKSELQAFSLMHHPNEWILELMTHAYSKGVYFYTETKCIALVHCVFHTYSHCFQSLCDVFFTSQWLILQFSFYYHLRHLFVHYE